MKTYEGLANALITAENIIEENLAIEWKDLVNILQNDPIIEPYYYEVIDALIAGRLSALLEQKN